MLQLDDVQLYDLSEAGALLFSDPARLSRLARLRQVPSARVETELGLPRPWVEAACGHSGADPESLRGYWLERLAPPAPDARRPRRAPDRLPAETLFSPEEAAARLFATPLALDRLRADGTLPALRVDGAVRYDATLVELVAREDEDEGAHSAAESRRAEVRRWARFEYDRAAAAPPAAVAPDFPSPPAASEPASQEEPAPAPGAWEIPDDLGVEKIAPLDAAPEKPPSTLIDVDGFETIDED